MNVITRNTLISYCATYTDAEQALYTWYNVAKSKDWKNFNEVKDSYPSADQVGADRMVFNIKGNKYRLIVRFGFTFKSVQIKWFGPHKEYDKIDVISVQLD